MKNALLIRCVEEKFAQQNNDNKFDFYVEAF
jgi:hypothetical protein